MKTALEEAQKGFDTGEVPIGSVAVLNGEIISRGHNMRRALDDPTAHAEMMCLRDLGMIENTEDITIYSTLEPCPMCSGAMIQTKIKNIVYGEDDILFVACGTALNVLNQIKDVNIVKHVLRHQCRDILLKFFKKELGYDSRKWFDIELPCI